MSVEKKSVMSSRPAQEKVHAQPVKNTEAIGESKTLSANALRPSRFAVTSKKARSYGGGGKR